MTPEAKPLVFPTQIRVFQFVRVPATLSPTTLKREVTARLLAFGPLKCSFCVIKGGCSQLLFLNVHPKVSINLSFTFYCEKTQKVWSMLCERQSASAEHILAHAPYPSVHASLQSLENQTPSLFNEETRCTDSVITTSCHLVSLL